MANCLAYERLDVGHSAVGPTAATVQGGVRCAVFYVDPTAAGGVRYRPDGTDPIATTGLPLGVGKSITIAGEGNIRNSRFIMTDDLAATTVVVHCLYYDQVDVVNLGLSSSDEAIAGLRAYLNDMNTRQEETNRLLEQLRFGLSMLVDTDLAKAAG